MTQPTPSPSHEFCDKADPEATHFWCAVYCKWSYGGLITRHNHQHHPDCGEFWQKPVKVKAAPTIKRVPFTVICPEIKPGTGNRTREITVEVREDGPDEVLTPESLAIIETAQSQMMLTRITECVKELYRTAAVETEWKDECVSKLEKELAQAKAESEEAMEHIHDLKHSIPQYPAPISTKDRLPTEKDAVGGCVLTFCKGAWRAWAWHGVNEKDSSLWLTPPPIPQVEKVKDEGEEAWKLIRQKEMTEKDFFLEGFQAGKESK